MANWDELPEELVIEIGERVGCYDDFGSIAEVSRHWSSALRNTKYCGRSSQVPWLMLRDDEDGSIRAAISTYRFYSLSKQMTLHQYSIPVEMKDVRCYSSHGWLLIVSRDLSMSLFNPFSSIQIQLPDKTSLGDHNAFDDEDMFAQLVQKFALSSSPSSGSDDFSVMIVYGEFSRLATWSTGDSAWTKVETDGGMIKGAFSDVTFCQGEFYAVDCECRVMACARSKPGNGMRNENPLKARVVADVSGFCSELVIPYLVESDSKLLVVLRGFASVDNPKFSVVEVNASNGEAVEVEDLGNRAFFLGDNHSLSVETSTRNGCKPNCIYLTDDGLQCRSESSKEGKWFSIYNLANGSTECYYAGELHSKSMSTLWIEPRH